jgi:hypothetical protein
MAESLPEPKRNPAEYIQRRIATYVGLHTARLAVKTFAQKALGVSPDGVLPSQAPTLIRALRPLLRSMLGNEPAERLVDTLIEEIST